MSDYLPDTPVIGRSWCPGCEPDLDPSREILDVRRCEQHQVPTSGADDAAACVEPAYLSGSGEVGGEDNRRWCDFFHRGRG